MAKLPALSPAFREARTFPPPRPKASARLPTVKYFEKKNHVHPINSIQKSMTTENIGAFRWNTVPSFCLLKVIPSGYFATDAMPAELSLQDIFYPTDYFHHYLESTQNFPFIKAIKNRTSTTHISIMECRYNRKRQTHNTRYLSVKDVQVRHRTRTNRTSYPIKKNETPFLNKKEAHPRDTPLKLFRFRQTMR